MMGHSVILKLYPQFSTPGLVCIAKLVKDNCFQKIRKIFVSTLALLGMSSSSYLLQASYLSGGRETILQTYQCSQVTHTEMTYTWDICQHE